MPPAPGGHDVSVSCPDAAVWRAVGPGLERLGYRAVRAAPCGGPTSPDARPAEPHVDVVVRDGAPQAWPTWWRAISALARRSYALELGPAAAAWAPVVDAHEEGR